MPPLSLGLGLGLSRGGRPFSPRDLSPALDLDASRDVYGTGATDVLFWLDQSGNGRDFSQASGATQPVYTPAGAASYVTLGEGRWAQGAGTAASWGWLHSAASYVAAVVYLPASASAKGSGLIATTQGFANVGALHVVNIGAGATTAGAQLIFSNASATPYTSATTTAVLRDAPTAVELHWSPSGPSPYGRVVERGVERGTATVLTGSAPAATPQFAARLSRISGNPANDTYGYRLYRLLAWDRLPSLAERDRLRLYLAARYGVPMTYGA